MEIMSKAATFHSVSRKRTIFSSWKGRRGLSNDTEISPGPQVWSLRPQSSLWSARSFLVSSTSSWCRAFHWVGTLETKFHWNSKLVCEMHDEEETEQQTETHWLKAQISSLTQLPTTLRPGSGMWGCTWSRPGRSSPSRTVTGTTLGCSQRSGTKIWISTTTPGIRHVWSSCSTARQSSVCRPWISDEISRKFNRL